MTMQGLFSSKSLERQYLGSLVVHNLLGCQITLVANKKLVHILIGIPVNLIQPLLHVVEALLVCDVVHNLQNAVPPEVRKLLQGTMRVELPDPS